MNSTQQCLETTKNLSQKRGQLKDKEQARLQYIFAPCSRVVVNFFIFVVVEDQKTTLQMSVVVGCFCM
jgi:hypothetical protein